MDGGGLPWFGSDRQTRLSEILGHGEITSDYVYEATRTEYKHLRSARWITTDHWQLPDSYRMPQKTSASRTGL